MHEKFLLAALEQAKYGQGQCAPNPSVGAVAVQNGVIIAQAWHKGAGTLHAEQLVLAQLPPGLPGVSMYVTLEPCNHWGRTPPCVGALVAYGIEAVYFAYVDPNPLVAQNNSAAALREHGIAVTHIPLPAITAFYRSYTYWTVTGKPWVTVKMAQSLDGKIAGEGGARILLSNDLCELFTQKQRLATDIILTTAKTIKQDNPRFNVRLEGQVLAKPLAIVDRQLSLPQDALVFSTASHCHVYHQGKKEGTYPNSTFYPIALKNGIMDLAQVISHLGLLGYHDVWVEVGGTVFTSLHQQGLVQTTYLYIAPTSVGPQGLSAYLAADIFDRPHQITWQALGDNMLACLEWEGDKCLLD